MYNYPQIYDFYLPSSFEKENKNLAAAVEKKHIEQSPWNKLANLSSMGGQEFLSFAKYTKFGKGSFDDSMGKL